MERKRFLDEEEQEEKEEREEKPQPAKPAPPGWTQWLSVAASLAAIITISVVTFGMAVGKVWFGQIVAYAMGSSLLIAVLLVLVIGFKYALPKFEPGLWRYIFLFIAIPIALLYYLIFAWLLYYQFAPLLVDMIEKVFTNAP